MSVHEHILNAPLCGSVFMSDPEPLAFRVYGAMCAFNALPAIKRIALITLNIYDVYNQCKTQARTGARILQRAIVVDIKERF